MTEAIATFLETWRALATPRRAIPILAVTGALVSSQVRYSPGARPFTLAVSICIAFVVFAPALWRALVGDEPSLPASIPGGVAYLLASAVVMGSVGVFAPMVIGMPATFLNTGVNLGVSSALFVVGGWGLGRDIGLELSLRRAHARSEALAREAERAQLLAVRAHLDPHFLFNTLNAIAEWCRQDGETAERAILELASILRSVLAGVKAPTWPLAQELELARKLFDLHLLRDSGLFALEFVAPDALLDVPVPPMLLLPLVENAVKHGPAKGFRGPLSFVVAREADGVRVTIENPGKYTGPREGSDGLPTVQRRLALAYGDRASIRIEGVGERTRTTVRLPESGPAEA